jgi:TolB-like protein/Tfp pilus assembly protein PilF
VFLSYASQDAEAAQRICEALRSAGVEVWFDQSELRGGDIWDQKIRRQVRECELFIPVISTNTTLRREGYFRLEWDLADQRTHMMARDRTFILPVCLDTTPEAGADVPESFHRAHWTRLAAGETPPAFIERVRRLLSPQPSPASTVTGSPAGPVSTATLAVGAEFSRSKRAQLAVIAAVVLGAVAYFVVDKFWVSKHLSPSQAAFAPPPHSIAVLPFVNLSGDKEQEYFSDGLTEELLNSLAAIDGLQVAARTSSFSFREHPDIATVAQKLNVGAVLEGSIRRSGHTIRVTAQLINAVTGFHLWSKTYDRDLGDVLRLQTEIATAVANALKVTLLGDLSAKIELGGTRNPAAFDAYLRASKAYSRYQNAQDLQGAIALYTEATRLDPEYALAFAERSLAFSAFRDNFARGPAVHASIEKSQADARRAVALAPDLGEGHLALADTLKRSLDFTRVSEEYERALALAPGSARVLEAYGLFAAAMGRDDAGIAAVRRAVALDPLNPGTHESLGEALMHAGRFGEAVAAFTDAKALAPDDVWIGAKLGGAYYGSGDFERAREVCEALKGENFNKLFCLACTYHKLGRRADAESMLAKLRASPGEEAPVLYAIIYAEWGETDRALDWLETAVRNHDPYLVFVKTGFASLRNEPRFQAIERELKFPE